MRRILVLLSTAFLSGILVASIFWGFALSKGERRTAVSPEKEAVSLEKKAVQLESKTIYPEKEEPLFLPLSGWTVQVAGLPAGQQEEVFNLFRGLGACPAGEYDSPDISVQEVVRDSGRGDPEGILWVHSRGQDYFFPNYGTGWKRFLLKVTVDLSRRRLAEMREAIAVREK